ADCGWSGSGIRSRGGLPFWRNESTGSDRGLHPLMPILSSDRLDPPASNDAILDAFLSYLIEAGIEPYAHQESAILELYAGHNVILNTPTGSGKSLVAMAVQFRAVCQGRRCYY